MEIEQFIMIRHEKNGVKARKGKRNSVGSTRQACSPEETNEAGNDSILLKTFTGYFRYLIFSSVYFTFGEF